jgi:hypothetical protein
MLFVAGIIDNLFSISASLDGSASWSMFTASKVCSAVFGTAVFILAGTIVHAIFRPLHSPFTSTLTNLIINGPYMWSFHVLRFIFCILCLCAPFSSFRYRALNVYDWIHDHIKHLREYEKVEKIQSHHVTAYHSIMSQTYDDNLLDDSSSALQAILQVTPDVGEKSSAQSMMELVAYLFTPAASRRSAMTASRVIQDYKPSRQGKQI